MPCDDSLDPLLRDLEGLRTELSELEARVARIQAAQGEFGAGGEFGQSGNFDQEDRIGNGHREPGRKQNQTRQPAAE
jgi:hypothetical protein